MSVLLLSPHRDDAAFSCGLSLAELVRGCVALRIANICTVSDYAPYADISDAVDRVAEITQLRAAEDVKFLELLQHDCACGQQGVQLLDLGWKDAPLRHGIAAEDVLAGGTVPPDEVARLAEIFRSLAPASIVLAPMALGGHVDHRLVRLAAIDVWPQDALVFYEDLPYACRMSPDECAEKTQLALPWACERAQALSARSGDKGRMALCYPSQIAVEAASEMEFYGAALHWTERLYGSPTALSTLALLSGSRDMVEDSSK